MHARAPRVAERLYPDVTAKSSGNEALQGQLLNGRVPGKAHSSAPAEWAAAHHHFFGFLATSMSMYFQVNPNCDG